MRILKFRAWDKTEKKMTSVTDISFGDDGSAKTITVQPAPKGKHYYGLVDGESGILMQYTGRHDMYSKDCYEGDIIKMFRSLLVVKWDEWFGRFELELVKGDDLKKIHDIGGIDMNVIVGNIYENPELLGVKQ